jgi:hypothetical protein
MVDQLLRADPLGLPVPPSWLFGLKVFGFILHMIFMNLWLAGMPTALLLRNSQASVADRLFKAMPFFMAFGINAGIVPLLFLQVLYPQFFYPATILQAWFWFLIIPLLIVAYYAVYFAAFGRYRVLAATVASLLLAWIGVTFSAAMTLTAAPQSWPAIFMANAAAGSVHGFALYLNEEALLRFFIMAGISCGTLAAFLALDAEFMTAKLEYRRAARRLVAPLYIVGFIVFGIAGLLYEPTVRDRLPELLRLVTGAAMPLGAILSIFYLKRPSRAVAGSLVAVHAFALISNASARQIVQFRSLDKWAKLDKMPVRGDWDSFFLFIIVLLVVLVCLAWLARVAVRAARHRGEPEIAER